MAPCNCNKHKKKRDENRFIQMLVDQFTSTKTNGVIFKKKCGGIDACNAENFSPEMGKIITKVSFS